MVDCCLLKLMSSSAMFQRHYM